MKSVTFLETLKDGSQTPVGRVFLRDDGIIGFEEMEPYMI